MGGHRYFISHQPLGKLFLSSLELCHNSNVNSLQMRHRNAESVGVLRSGSAVALTASRTEQPEEPPPLKHLLFFSGTWLCADILTRLNNGIAFKIIPSHRPVPVVETMCLVGLGHTPASEMLTRKGRVPSPGLQPRRVGPLQHLPPPPAPFCWALSLGSPSPRDFP